MYNKQQSAILTQQFWTSFGQYMAPVPSAEGQKINWVNYKTGVKDIHFTMQADKHQASIGIALTHTDLAKQLTVFKQFEQLRPLLHDTLQEEWQWRMQVQDEHKKIISRIDKNITGINIYRQEDWPAIISFFKPRIIALDAFWCDVRFGFEM